MEDLPDSSILVGGEGQTEKENYEKYFLESDSIMKADLLVKVKQYHQNFPEDVSVRILSIKDMSIIFL